MGKFTRLALALSLPLVAIIATAAPTTKSTSLPDIANMRYQARNYKTLFNSDRSERINEINKLIVDKSQKSLSRTSSLTPDFSLPASDQYEYLDGPNGAVYLCSAEFETEEFQENEYYTRKDITGYHFKIYDTGFNLIGEVKGKVQLDTITNPDNPETRVASMGLTPVLTRRFFNSDDKFEVLVYFNFNTPDYTVNCRSMAFQLGGEKDEEGYDKPLCTINGNLCDVLEAPSGKWSEDYYLSFATDYAFPTEPGDDSFEGYVNSLGVLIETYKKVPYGSNAPAKIFEYKMRLNDWPGDQENATPLISRCIDGKPYFIVNGYTDGLWLFDEPGESGFSEQIWNDQTKFFVDIYQPTSLENPNLLQHTEIDMKLSEGDNIFATFYYLGNLGYREDVNYDYCDEEGKANLVITTKDWDGAEMGTTSSYYLYSPSGELKTTLGEKIDGVLGMSDINGQEPEYMFISLKDDQYLFTFLNPFNGNVHHQINQVLPWNGSYEGLYVNADRVASGDSYKYCFELSSLGLDDKGNDIMRIGWVNTDGEIISVDEINMGQNVNMANVYIGQEVLSPYTFDTTPEREYMIIVKRGQPFSAITQEEFIISTAATEEKPTGNILLEITPDDVRGNLIQISALDLQNNPTLWVMFYDYMTSKYTQDFYRLPFSKFAGGEGTAENPYKIATIGDFQCIREDLTAHYEIINDLDADGISFISLGNSQNPFSGSIKGNGHNISNLTVSGSIFSYLDNASISGINFINAKVMISDELYTGLLAKEVQRSTISDIHVVGLTAESQASTEFGGIADKITLSTVISGCSVSNANISLPNASVVGGIVADSRTSSTIIASSFTGSITAKSVVGGILGTSCSNAGPVSDCHVDADLSAENIVGGIIGDMDHRITINRCYVEGNLTATTTFGTRILNKGYAVGGVVGMVSNYYPNENSGNPDATPAAVEVVTNCFVNLGSINTPELPDGHQSSVHRIAGFTSINNLEPDWDNIVDYEHIDKFLPTEAELGLRNNYAVASLAKVDSNVASEVSTTEGKDIDAYDLSATFFEGLGFKYGQTANNPWNEMQETDPALYHEFGSKFVMDEITAAVNTSFGAELLIVSRQPMTVDSFIDGFAADISDESVVEMNGELTLNNNVAVIGFNALKVGNAEFTANVNGNLAKVMFTIVNDLSGIDNVVASGDALSIVFDGTTVSASDAYLAVYTTDGKKVAAGYETLNISSLANGVYIVTAADKAGNKTARKFMLQ